MGSPLSLGYTFKIVEGHLCKINRITRRVVARRPPLGKSIVQVLRSGPNLVVREDYYDFPRGESNVYCLTQDLCLVWRAELPFMGDIYANPVTTTLAGLHCASWDGMSCTLDPETGRIVSKVFTK